MVEYKLSRKSKSSSLMGRIVHLYIILFYFEEKKINRKYIIPNIIEQNDVSKGNNRTLISYATSF